MLRRLFSSVTYTCDHCGSRQRIPLRRVHFFERVHGLTHGEVVLIACPTCLEGLQLPAPYLTHTGHETRFDPQNPHNVVVHAD
jgi:hypothetical protein